MSTVDLCFSLVSFGFREQQLWTTGSGQRFFSSKSVFHEKG